MSENANPETGTFYRFTAGGITVTENDVVLVVTQDQLADGSRTLSRTWTPLARRTGSALAYDTSPIPVVATNGRLTLGQAGVFPLPPSAPLGGFEDFAIYKYDAATYPMYDPVDGFAITDNDLANSAGVGSTWSRHYRIMYPPKKARFMVPHVVFQVVPTHTSQYMDAVQFEVLSKSASAVTAYSAPREIRTYVQPNRLNYSSNPCFKTSTNNWTNVTRAADTTSPSGFVGRASGTSTITHTFGGLTVGQTYTASVYVTSATNLASVAAQIKELGYGNTAYGSGAYGGREISRDVNAVQKGVRVWITFQASQRSHTLQILPTAVSGTTPAFSVSRCLIEEGTGLNAYFDGDSGADYLWETSAYAGSTTVAPYGSGPYGGGGTIPYGGGGTGSGEARSYYYANRVQGNYLIKKILQDNSALGTGIADPQFAIAPPGSYGLVT